MTATMLMVTVVALLVPFQMHVMMSVWFNGDVLIPYPVWAVSVGMICVGMS